MNQTKQTGSGFLIVRRCLYLLLLTGCAAPKSTPPMPPIRHLALPKRIAANAPQVITLPRTNTVPWQYAPGASNYCWTLQTSSNLVDWVDLPGACVTDPLFAYATNAAAFFRLKGSQ
jgi:hypothetical protein